VEEMAAAAGSLKSQAQDLVQVVAAFKLSDVDAMPKTVQKPRAIASNAVLVASKPASEPKNPDWETF